MQDYLPSGLIPNAERVMDNLKHVPTSVGFQASATPGINYNKAKVDFLKDWKDLADERLKGKLLLWLPGDITAGGMLLGMCDSLGLDYHNPDQVNAGDRFHHRQDRAERRSSTPPTTPRPRVSSAAARSMW